MYTNSVNANIDIKKIQHCRLAMFGGTFDPIHLGHTNVLRHLYTHNICDYVFIVPTSKNPLKKNTPHASSKDRMYMITLATREYDFAIPYPFEIMNTDVSFTVDSIQHIHDTFCPKGLIQLIIGSDVLPELNSWKGLHTILTMSEFMVVPRPSYDITTYPAIDIPYTILDGFKHMDMNSTAIRAGINVHSTHFLDAYVLQYIKEKKLYGF